MRNHDNVKSAALEIAHRFARVALVFAVFAVLIRCSIEPALAAEPVTPPDAAIILQQSTVALEANNTPFCTATKIGPRKFLTAAHCVAGVSKFSVNFEPEISVEWPKFIMTPIGTQEDGVRNFDWALITTHSDIEGAASANFGCDEEIYLGQPVATFGYSSASRPSFSVGIVSSLTHGVYPNQYDFAIDVQAAPGASGSAVISLDTGDIIGVLTEGVFSPRIGPYLVGVQEIKDVEVCE